MTFKAIKYVWNDKFTSKDLYVQELKSARESCYSEIQADYAMDYGLISIKSIQKRSTVLRSTEGNFTKVTVIAELPV